MASIDFRLKAGALDEILDSPEVAALLQRLAEGVASQARAIAPIGPERGGHYRDSIAVEAHETDRATYRIHAQAPYALKLEAKYRILGTALGSAHL